jgi:hypothetical protein
MKRKILILVGALVVILFAIQLVPVHRTNPPVVADFDGPAAVENVLRTSCYDCHSHESRWPWYSHVAPASWLVLNDVAEGREHLNASEWNRPQKHARHAAKEVREGDMPLWLYAVAHPQARLSDGERRELAAGLEKTFGVPGPEDRRGRDDD